MENCAKKKRKVKFLFCRNFWFCLFVFILHTDVALFVECNTEMGEHTDHTRGSLITFRRSRWQQQDVYLGMTCTVIYAHSQHILFIESKYTVPLLFRLWPKKMTNVAFSHSFVDVVFFFFFCHAQDGRVWLLPTEVALLSLFCVWRSQTRKLERNGKKILICHDNENYDKILDFFDINWCLALLKKRLMSD